MTVIVSVKINDGIVMAADSMSSFAHGHSYQNANKIANLRKGLPIGAMVTGLGGIKSESIETLFKDLRKRLSGEDPDYLHWEIDPNNYTIFDVANRVREFLFEEKTNSGEFPIWMLVRICGYSSARPLAEAWDVRLLGNECRAPYLVHSEDNFGPRWEGEVDALNRLILGLDQRVLDALSRKESSPEELDDLASHLYETLAVNAMPIQDAVDLARYLVDVTSGFVRFSATRQKTVGGPVEIATITKHEGFKWVQRKHFFSRSLNENY